MSIRSELLLSFKKGNTLTKLIYINLIVFLLVGICHVVCRLMLFDDSRLLSYIAMPAHPIALLHKPWTLISYMFVHQGFIHILFNVLNLYWFGKLFLTYFNQKQLVGLYILGGIFGGLFYLLAFNLLPYYQTAISGSILLGASASVLAIMTGIAAYNPNMEIGLILIGRVKLIYIAIVFFFLSLFSVVGQNAGGNLAHLGGIGMGYLFALRMKKGKDLTKGLNRLIDFFVDLFTRKPKMKVSQGKRPVSDFDWNANKARENRTIDDILDKIKKSGYDSLTAEEKKKLFDQSKK